MKVFLKIDNHSLTEGRAKVQNWKFETANGPLTETILHDILLLLFIQANFSFLALVVQRWIALYTR